MNDDVSFTEQRALDVDKTIERLKATIAKLGHFISILPHISHAFDKCYWIHCYEEGNIIAECKTREDFAQIRALHKGVWIKNIKGKTVRYEAVVEQIPISVVVGQLPPSCRLIEKKIIVPEHEETVYETVCS